MGSTDTRTRRRSLLVPEDIGMLERNPPRIVHKFYDIRRIIRQIKENGTRQERASKLSAEKKRALEHDDKAFKMEGNRRVIDEEMVDLIVISSDEDERDDEGSAEVSEESEADVNVPSTPVELKAALAIQVVDELRELEQMFHLLDYTTGEREDVMNFLEVWKGNILESFQKVVVDSTPSPSYHEFMEVIHQMKRYESKVMTKAHFNMSSSTTAAPLKIKFDISPRVSIPQFKEKILEFIDCSSGRDISRLFAWIVEKRAILANQMVNL